MFDAAGDCRKAEIHARETTAPPQNFTADTIRARLESIKAAAGAEAGCLLIGRIDTYWDRENEKAAFHMQSK